MQIDLQPDSAIVIPRVKIVGPKGTREVDMLLDTGAMYTSISWDVAEDIGYSPGKVRQMVPIVTANGIIEAPLLKVASVRAGELKVNFIPVICHNIPEVVEVEGLLGLSFLRNFTTTIDFRLKTLIIE